MVRFGALLAAAFALFSAADAAEPIIDMHIHAQPVSDFGPPGQKFCVPDVTRPFDPGRGASWPEEWDRRTHDGACERWLPAADSDEALMRETLSAMRRRNVIAVAGGPTDVVSRWKEAAPERIIAARNFNLAGDSAVSVEELRGLYRQGVFRVLAEVTNQYAGFGPDAPEFEPYWALAEEEDFPVGVHMGPMPPGSTYLFGGRARIALGNPLLLEEVLAKHPKLRVYVMHAGYPFADNMIAMLDQYPQLYVELGVLPLVMPRAQFYDYLTRLTRAGLGDRVMFGSDQMIWPDIIEEAIRAIEKAPLTKAQKRDIFYNNAARFLRLSDEEIAAHKALDR
ncbi:MAG: amidohydrolase family protein [Pseudomonadota bacterium]|nr:amidohydrolase family protein [Pseudomonadota bacterium]